MTIESERQMLEILLQRKRDAEKLPPDVLNSNDKYKKNYEAICKNIEILRRKLETTWDESAADKLLKQATEYICHLDWEDCNEFFINNPEFDSLITVMGKKIDEAYATKSLDAVRQAITKYKDTCIEVNNHFMNQKRMMEA